MIDTDRRRAIATWALVFLFSLSLRVVLLELLPREPNLDELGYVRLAEEIARDGVASAVADETHRSPLFPLLHSILVRTGLGGIRAGFALAVIVGSLAPVGVGLLFRRAFGTLPALGAALAVALHPFTVSFSRWIQPELLAAVLLLGFALLWERDRPVLAAVVLALGYLTRPELVTLLPLWIVVELVRRKHPPRRLLLAGGCFVLVAMPWLIHLHDETGRFCLSGKDRWVYLNGIAQVETGDGPVRMADLERLDAEIPGVLSHIAGAPLEFLHGYAIRCGYLLRHLAGLVPWPAFPLVALGLGVTWTRRRRALLFLAFPLLLLPVLPVGMTHQRHLVTLLPVLVGFGGVGVVEGAVWLRRRLPRRDIGTRRATWMAIAAVFLSVTVALVAAELGLRLAGEARVAVGELQRNVLEEHAVAELKRQVARREHGLGSGSCVVCRGNRAECTLESLAR